MPSIMASERVELPQFSITATTTSEIYTLSLHDALPIFDGGRSAVRGVHRQGAVLRQSRPLRPAGEAETVVRSEEHTSELQSRLHLVCRLLLEKKKIHRA